MAPLLTLTGGYRNSRREKSISHPNYVKLETYITKSQSMESKQYAHDVNIRALSRTLPFVNQNSKCIG